MDLLRWTILALLIIDVFCDINDIRSAKNAKGARHSKGAKRSKGAKSAKSNKSAKFTKSAKAAKSGKSARAAKSAKNPRRPSGNGGALSGLFSLGGQNRFKNDGTKKPVSTGRDETFPSDCGRNTKTGRGNLCFPDGKLCQERVNRQGNQRFGNHLYWMSWQSDNHELRTAEWDWFNARNYCRKRCMDLVSIETREEYEWIKQQMGGVKYIWTSGRLCDFDGCDRPDFFPKLINGWFWSANQARLSPTNSTSAFHDWSITGGASRPQPDNREGKESCMAVLNNFYGDGIKWHDVACEHEKPIICEDTEGHLNYARQHFPHLQIP